MYLPKGKYKEAKFTQGTKFTLDGKPYIGWYFETYKKQFFSGTRPSSSSELLQPIEASVEDKFKFVTDTIGPSLDEYNKGSFIRYILLDKRNGKIIETKRNKFDYFKKNSYIIEVTLKWELTGPADKVIVNGYEYRGTASKNEQAVKEAEKQIKGLSNFITDYKKFIK